MRNRTYTDDPFFQVYEYRYYHPRLTREYTVLQVTDLHMMAVDETSTQERILKVSKQKAAWWPLRLEFARIYGDEQGEEHLLDPVDGLEHIVALANEKKPDALLMTGDMMDDFSEENFRCLQNACKRLSVPWMWVCGNHEQGHEERYGVLTNGNPFEQTIDLGEMKFIGIHDALKKTVSASQLAFLKREAEGVPVPVLVMHIPMLTANNTSETARFDPYFLLGTGEVDPDTRAFLEFMQSGDDPFAMALCGHVHGTNLSEYRPGHPQLCVSSAMVGVCALLRFLPADSVRFEA